MTGERENYRKIWGSHPPLSSSPSVPKINIAHFSDQRIEEIYRCDPPMTLDERFFLYRNTPSFEECEYSSDDLKGMTDQALMSVCYDVWADYARGAALMKMSELILAVGDDNVVFQNLLNDARAIEKNSHGTKITFYTNAIQAEELMGGGQTKKLGLVLWLPRDRVDAAIAAEKAKKDVAA